MVSRSITVLFCFYCYFIVTVQTSTILSQNGTVIFFHKQDFHGVSCHSFWHLELGPLIHLDSTQLFMEIQVNTLSALLHTNDVMLSTSTHRRLAGKTPHKSVLLHSSNRYTHFICHAAGKPWVIFGPRVNTYKNTASFPLVLSPHSCWLMAFD